MTYLVRTRSGLGILALVCSALALPGAAQAALKWTFNDDSTCVGGSSACSGWESDLEFESDSGAGPNVTASGWANTDNSNTEQAQGEVQRFGGGLGVRNADAGGGDSGEGTSPEHAVDNNGRYDWVLLDFGNEDIALDSVSIGYWQEDSDMSVLYYDGAGSPSDSVDGAWLGNDKTFTDLVADGWKLVDNSHLFNVGSEPGDTATFNANHDQVSSHWLVGAHNDNFGDPDNPTPPTSGYYDHVKISSVTGEFPPPTTSVPEPSSLLLLGLPLLAGAGRRAASRLRRAIGG